MYSQLKASTDGVESSCATGGTYPSGGVSLPGDPSGRTTGNAQTANAQSAGQAVNIQRCGFFLRLIIVG